MHNTHVHFHFSYIYSLHYFSCLVTTAALWRIGESVNLLFFLPDPRLSTNLLASEVGGGGGGGGDDEGDDGGAAAEVSR